MSILEEHGRARQLPPLVLCTVTVAKLLLRTHLLFKESERHGGEGGGVKERARAKERMREREGKKGSENLRGTETENERRKKTESERERKKGRERGEQ